MFALRNRIPMLAVLAAFSVAGCGGDAADEPPAGLPAEEDAAEPAPAASPIAGLLASDQVVFGIFAGDFTPEQGASMAAVREADFVFYSLEDGPFDIPTMRSYIQAMHDAAAEAGVEPRPVLLRIPPITDAETARQQVQQGLEAGAAGIVFPHIATAEQARISVELLGDDLWPQNADGGLVNVALVEDQEGIANTAQIASTPGLSVVIPGPGDLRRAYEGDMDAVESAIQTVLAACKTNNVACGITAGVDDIGARIEQGFRFFIVSDPESLTAGRQAAGRTDG